MDTSESLINSLDTSDDETTPLDENVTESDSVVLQMQARQDIIAKIISQRYALFQEIGKGKVSYDSDESTLRIVAAKKQVNESIQRLQAIHDSLTYDIQVHKEEVNINTEAEAYLSELERRSENMRLIREYAALGEEYVPKEVLAQREQEYREFVEQGKSERMLKGIAILESHKKREQDINPSPKLSIHTESREVHVVTNRNHTFTLTFAKSSDYMVLLYLAQRLNQKVSTTEIKTMLKSVGFPNERVFTCIKYLLKDLESDPEHPTIVASGAGKAVTYQLHSDVTFIQEETKAKNPFEQKYMPPHKSRIHALIAITEEPATPLDNVLRILGPSRREKPLTWVQAKFALKKAVGNLYFGVSQKFATEEEQKQWENLKSSIHNSDDLSARELLLAYIETWFLSFRKQK